MPIGLASEFLLALHWYAFGRYAGRRRAGRRTDETEVVSAVVGLDSPEAGTNQDSGDADNSRGEAPGCAPTIPAGKEDA